MIENLRDSIGGLGKFLPVIFLGLVILGDIMYGVAVLLPVYETHQELSAQLVSAEVALSQLTVEQIELDESAVLASQIENIDAQLAEAAGVFLTDSQGDSILDRLYAYSDEAGVDITNLQLQPADEMPTAQPYAIRRFRLQVSGPIARLLNYVMRIRGAALPTIIIENITISQDNGQGLLVMDVTIYTSSYSDGAALDALEPRDVPPPPALTATPTPTPPPGTPTPATATPIVAAPTTDAASAALPLATPTQSVALVNDGLLPTPTTSTADCSNAPAPQFTPGETVIVDFNGVGALRILSRAGGGSYQTLMQVYDNQPLVILDGPVCGPWREGNVWYWLVEVSNSNVRGWAGEASVTQRWMCPQDNPECA